MTAWAWLVAAAMAATAGWAVGWPTWTASRARRASDLNAERYLAWRGRAGRPVEASLTRRERQRLIVAGLLAVAAAFCVVGFFTYA